MNGQTNALCSLGEVYLLQREYTGAARCYTLAREISTRIGYDESRANALSGLGRLYDQKSKHRGARLCEAEAHAIYARIDGRKCGVLATRASSL